MRSWLHATVWLIMVGTVPAWVGISPARGAPPAKEDDAPPYHADARFDRALPAGVNSFRQIKLLEMLHEVTQAPIVMPVAALVWSAQLDRDHRQARDLMDQFADFSRGEWKKVGDGYVLQVPTELLSLLKLSFPEWEKRAKDLLRLLNASLSDRQLRVLANGGQLARTQLSRGQTRYLREIGALGYYSRPGRIDPNAVQGVGISLGLTGGQITLVLPQRQRYRKSRPFIWLRQPLFPEAPAE